MKVIDNWFLSFLLWILMEKIKTNNRRKKIAV